MKKGEGEKERGEGQITYLNNRSMYIQLYMQWRKRKEDEFRARQQRFRKKKMSLGNNTAIDVQKRKNGTKRREGSRWAYLAGGRGRGLLRRHHHRDGHNSQIDATRSNPFFSSTSLSFLFFFLLFPHSLSLPAFSPLMKLIKSRFCNISFWIMQSMRKERHCQTKTIAFGLEGTYLCDGYEGLQNISLFVASHWSFHFTGRLPRWGKMRVLQ